MTASKRTAKEPSVWVVEMRSRTSWHRVDAYARLNEARRGFHAMNDGNPQDEFRISEYRRVPAKEKKR